MTDDNNEDDILLGLIMEQMVGMRGMMLVQIFAAVDPGDRYNDATDVRAWL